MQANEVLSGLVVSVNVDNVFNKQPPNDPTYTGIDNQNYNDYGRSYFIGANYNFGRQKGCPTRRVPCYSLERSISCCG